MPKYKNTLALGVCGVILITILAAVLSKRPVSVGMNLGNVTEFYIEMDVKEAHIGYVEPVGEGPPAPYLAMFEMEDGRKLYVTREGCITKEGVE
jgi:hypothetical protein